MNCKDGKCGIRGGNMTRAQKPRFSVGDTVYVIFNIKRINGEIEHIFYKRNKVLTIGVFAGEYIYCLDKTDSKVFEKNIYSAEQIRRSRFSSVIE